MSKKGQKNTSIQRPSGPGKVESLEDYNACLKGIHLEAGIYFKALWSVYINLNNLLIKSKQEGAGYKLLKKRLSNLSEILQYDDVLSQKLNHIIEIHNLIDGSSIVATQEFEDKTANLYTKDLLYINEHQLELIIKEFKCVYKKTVDNLSSLSVEIETLHNAEYIKTVIDEIDRFKSLKLVFELPRFDEIEKLLATYSKNLQSLSELRQSFVLSFDQINSLYTVDSERNVLHQVLDSLGKANATLMNKSKTDRTGAIDLF